jgi:hypothetical protein
MRFSSSNVPRERRHFRSLLLSNPNYFGNVKQSAFEPVVAKSGDTTYEELGCIGFQPQQNLLNAVVYVKLPSGFSGDICTAGSQEYVRFFASYDSGATWVDLGVTSFTVFDIPETQHKPFVRLEYAVSLPFDPDRKLCFFDNLVLVRGILSWNVPPPPNEPDTLPIWGSVHDTTVEVEPLRLIVLSDVLTEVKLAPSSKLAQAVDLTQTIKTASPKELSVADLAKLYAGKDVQPHRFALTQLNRALRGNADVRLLAADFGGPAQLFGVEFDVPKAVAAIESADGDTTYEQLECVGLNEKTWTLEGVVRIKRANGYSGGPCTTGSTEYVTFWADLDGSAAFATCLGTASVTVYDVADIPRDGLEFAVTLPTSLFAYRQPCSAGPKLIPIRAILSWQIAPPCADSNFKPTWGNREETLICLPPGPSVQPGMQSAFFDTVGSMSVNNQINAGSGLADGVSALAGFTAVQSPFGGEVTVTGYIYPASNLSAGDLPFKYQISVSENGGPWIPLNDAFTLPRTLIPWGGVPVALGSVTQAPDAAGVTKGFYTYQADWTTGPGDALIMVAGNALAKWQTAGKNSLCRIKMDVYDPSTNTFFAGVNTATILLDNVAPVPKIDITSGGGSCGDFHVGDQISGTYSVADLHFHSLSLQLLPGLGGTFTAPMPLPRHWTDPGASTFGDVGTWTLDTTGLPPCGYVVRLQAGDRTIVDSGRIGFTSEDSKGFCLKKVVP